MRLAQDREEWRIQREAYTSGWSRAVGDDDKVQI